MPAIGAKTFFSRTQGAKKVMVLDLGFLGDTVHLLPSLWMVRQAYPQAELHATVASHVVSFMDCVPWVNKVWGYMRYPRHATIRENLDIVSRLRRERFDVVINLNGSDRSSWLTFLSGARERLGRVPDDGGPPFWRRMFTDHVQHPSDAEPLYLQRCHCLEKAGWPFFRPEFHVEVTPENLRTAQITEDDSGTYFHISLFTTANYKELSPAQLVEFIGALNAGFPQKKIVLSCAPTVREKAKMTELLALLPQKPWRTFTGNLNLIQITAVIKHSALHFCGDTGTLHLAMATQTPCVSWFWPNPALGQWVESGKNSQVIVGTNEPEAQFLGGIASGDLVTAAQKILSA